MVSALMVGLGKTGVERTSLILVKASNMLISALVLTGTANLTDMLADPGQSGEGVQAVGDASASPLFKWTSDGSMMEELMKAYK